METHNQPSVMIIDEKALKQGNKKNWFSAASIVQLIMFAIVLSIPVEVYFGYQYLKSGSPSLVAQSKDVIQSQEVKQGQGVAQNQPIGDTVSIFLMPLTENVSVGDTLNLSLKLATFGRAIGNVTAVIKYDPKMVDLIEGSPFTKGEVYSINPLVTKNAPKNLIRISGQTGSPIDGYTGVGILGTLKLKVKKAGNITISLDPSSQAIDYFSNNNVLGTFADVSLTAK